MSAHDPLSFEIDGMTCAACVGRAERAIAAVTGVERAAVNPATHGGRVILEQGAGPDVAGAVSGGLTAAGYPAVPGRVRLAIAGKSCASCVSKVEAALMAVPGVLSAHVNLVDAVATVATLGRNEAALIAAVQAVGYGAAPVAGQAQAVDRLAKEVADLRSRGIWAAVLTVPVFVLEMGGHLVTAFHHWIMMSIGLQAGWMVQFGLTTLVMAGPGVLCQGPACAVAV